MGIFKMHAIFQFWKALSGQSVGPVTVQNTRTQYPQNLHYTNGNMIFKYELNRMVSFDAIRILREDTV